MTTEEFAPKGEETLKTEILAELGLDYEGNEEMVDKMVARELKGEDFKASVHKDKMSNRDKLKEARKLLNLDPETGEKIETKVEEKKGGELSLKDIRALNDVPDEDVDDVTEYAKFKGISVAEAKVSPVIQTLLKTKAEQRKSAEVANTTTTKRNNSKSSEEALFKKVEAKEDLSDEEIREATRVMLKQKMRT